MEQDELEELKSELQLLNIKIKEGQQMAADKTFQEVLKDIEKEAKFRVKQRRILKGHISKVTSAHFCGDSKKAVSGSLDGKLIIWDVFSGNKMRVIPLRSSWVMACAFDEQGNYVAVGGMDNMCTVYDLRGTNAKVRRELAGMDGYLSSVRFLGDSQVITGSGDTHVVLWDLERGQKVVTFEAHEGDVISLSLNPDKTTFVTGSVDNTARRRSRLVRCSSGTSARRNAARRSGSTKLTSARSVSTLGATCSRRPRRTSRAGCSTCAATSNCAATRTHASRPPSRAVACRSPEGFSSPAPTTTTSTSGTRCPRVESVP
ncbi:guanine nucleotide-binding protein subunit beta-2 isoform X2 [Rhipicephalus sanguineus]|uniref:guanine nucleotide-binding protein subunit beta-2 isoform X2 n=1 Tax=Rhipicephalus sanguineus TaxID=34632 RepID=UPI00189615AB|nr:guanine nucleotide-binding protein subunit beta-2 isoform X2 [Rhipicephalus sanguineus]